MGQVVVGRGPGGRGGGSGAPWAAWPQPPERQPPAPSVWICNAEVPGQETRANQKQDHRFDVGIASMILLDVDVHLGMALNPKCNWVNVASAF